MQFSGKITNSVLSHLSRRGWDREKLFELTQVPLEYLRDPSTWIAAHDVESFLRAVEFEVQNSDPQVLQKIGWQAAELRAWGVLDSVLRMMQKPQDIFSQPHRFLSYFISPAPPIGNLQRSEEMVSFDVPISPQEYPLTVAYLTAALEALPTYFGQERAQVRWRQTNIFITWSEAQASLLRANEEATVNPKPELVQSLLKGVELAQAQLEARELEIVRLEQKVLKLREQLKDQSRVTPVTDRPTLAPTERVNALLQVRELRGQIAKLMDYFTRAQQAITLARAAQREDVSFQAALRRIDWETVRTQYPWLHMQISEGLSLLEQRLDDQSPERAQGSETKSKDRGLRLGEVLEQVADRARSEFPQGLRVSHHASVAEPVGIDTEKLQLALLQVVNLASRSIGHRGEIEMRGWRTGPQLQVSVSGRREGAGRRPRGVSLPLLQGIEEGESLLASARAIMRQQDGDLQVEFNQGEERKFICQWPAVQL